MLCHVRMCVCARIMCACACAMPCVHMHRVCMCMLYLCMLMHHVHDHCHARAHGPRTCLLSCACMFICSACMHVCVMHDQYHAWPLYTFLHVCDDPSHWLLYPAPPHRRMKTAVFEGDNQHRVNTRTHVHTYSALSWHVCTGRTSSHTQHLHAMCRTAQSVRVSLAIALRGSSTTTCCCRCLS